MIRLPPGALLIASLLALAACSNDPHPKPLAEKRPDGSPWLVRYSAMGDEPRSLDPQFAYDEMSRRVLEPIMDMPLEYDPMKTNPYELRPCMLEEIPKGVPNAKGGVDYKCRLKRGILYHDSPCFPEGKGREVTSADFLFAFQRMCDPKVECPVFSALADYVEGMNEVYEAAKKNGGNFDYSEGISGFEVRGPYNFTLHLTKPYPQILYWMAMHFTSPVAHEAIDYFDGQHHPGEKKQRPSYKFHPVGSGAFMFVEYVPGQRVRMRRNPNYHTVTFPTGGWSAEFEALNRPLAGKPIPILDEINITIFREALPNWLLTRQGYQDGMGVGKDAYNSVVTPIKTLSQSYRDKGMTLDKDVDPSTFFITLNMQDPVIGTNKKLRQALSAAFDRQSWIDIFYNGVPTVAEQLIPPGVIGFRPELRNPYGYNLVKAKRLLAEAGYPNGIDPKTGQPLELTLDCVASGAEERQSAEYEQRQFQQLGIRIKVVENNFARMLEKEDQGNFQMASGSGWMADYPDAENFFFLFYSKNIPPVGKNAARYTDPEFDKDFEQMSSMENSPERAQIIDRMNVKLLEDCPMILSFNKAAYVIVQPWAPRTHANVMLEGGLKFAVLDPTLREQKRREWNRKPYWPLGLAGVCFIGLVAYGVRWNRQRNV
jgi:oligopeptide transport system substrate-binding protein